MIERYIQPPDGEAPIHNAVKQVGYRRHDLFGGRGVSTQADRAMRMLRDCTPIAVPGRVRLILGAKRRIPEIFDVIADRQHQLIRHKPLVYEFQNQQVGHLPHHQFCFVKGVGTLQHLTGTDAVRAGPIRLDVGNRAGLPAPRVVNEQFRVDSKQMVQQVFVMIRIGFSDRAPGDIAHRIQPDLLQLAGIASANTPEICQGTM